MGPNMNHKTFERYVTQAVQSLPDQFKEALSNIEIVIEDHAQGEPLLGLYEGIPLPEREMGGPSIPDKISIYREEILSMGLSGIELVEEIRLTVLHEIGHYFGLDDEELEQFEPGWEGDEKEVD
jgi:predicted Zn-dependent protease with MMP-like domain